MSEMISVHRSTNMTRLWYGRFSPATKFRVGMVMTLIVVMSVSSVYWSRRAVWAVVNVGGSILTMRPPFASRNQRPEPSLPAFAFPFWRWTETNVNVYLPTNDRISGVNLAHVNVDHRWLPHLRPMKSLEILSLDQKQVGVEMSSLARLPKLREVIVLNVDSETELLHLMELPHLQRLRLVILDRPVTGLAVLGKHPSLQELDLEALGLKSQGWGTLLSEYDDRSHVQTLSIRSRYSLSPGLESLKFLKLLRTLDISAPLTHSDIAAISQLKQLTSLIMNTKNVAIDDWLMLKPLQGLQFLKIYSGGDEPPPLEELRSVLANCEIEGGA